tara:strand:+ start:1000 stop:1371 length:372 start_codon:yes stop_codon:yes gene_type:complete
MSSFTYNGTKRTTPVVENLADRPVDDPTVRLGDSEMERAATSVARQRADRCGAVYMLTWAGSKIPRKAVINGWEVIWTQHGLVTAEKDGRKDRIGTYTREAEWAGDEGDLHRMKVYVDPKFCG